MLAAHPIFLMIQLLIVLMSPRKASWLRILISTKAAKIKNGGKNAIFLSLLFVSIL